MTIDKKNIIINVLLFLTAISAYKELFSTDVSSSEFILEGFLSHKQFYALMLVLAGGLLFQDAILYLQKAMDNSFPSRANFMILSAASDGQKEILNKFVGKPDQNIKLNANDPSVKELVGLEVLEASRSGSGQFILKEEFKTAFKIVFSVEK